MEIMLDEDIIKEPVSFEEQHQVVRRNTGFYDLKWAKKFDPASGFSWNWAAFFLNTLWFAYRKMYKQFYIFCGLELIWFSLSFLVEIPLWSDVVFYLMCSLVIGMCANGWYYKQVMNILSKVEELPEIRRDAYFQTKGGTHIGVALGLTALAIAVFLGTGTCLSYIPTKANVKSIVSSSDEGITLEAYNDDAKWTYVEKRGRHYVVEFSGYDYAEKENVLITFNIYLDKQLYEWKDIYIDGKKLNQDDAYDYETWIEEESSW